MLDVKVITNWNEVRRMAEKAKKEGRESMIIRPDIVIDLLNERDTRIRERQGSIDVAKKAAPEKEDGK